MSGCVTLTINLFGVFRTFAQGQPFILSLPKGACLEAARASLKAALKESHAGFDRETLVDESAFADDRQVLPEDTVFESDMELAVLPPVCGG